MLIKGIYAFNIVAMFHSPEKERWKVYVNERKSCYLKWKGSKRYLGTWHYCYVLFECKIPP